MKFRSFFCTAPFAVRSVHFVGCFFIVVGAALSSFGSIVFAQATTNDEVFKVVACKGAVTLDRTKKNVAVGQALNAADRLQLKGKCYLGLVHKSGKTLEVRKEGTVAVTDLLKQTPPTQNGFDKLVGFVVQSMTNAPSAPANEMAGGVERGVNMERLRLLMPRTSKVSTTLDSALTFSWSGAGKTKNGEKPQYEFTLADAEHNVRFKHATPDTVLRLSLVELSLHLEANKGQCYYWSVAQTNAATPFATAPSYESYCVFPLTADEDKTLQTQLQALHALRTGQAAIATALDELVTAMFYEQQGYISRAFQTYRTLLKSDDADAAPVFQAAYEQFLRRVGIDAHTQTLLR